MTKMTPQNPKMLTVKYKKKRICGNRLREKNILLFRLLRILQNITYTVKNVWSNMSPVEIIQGLFIIYVGKVEQIRYH